MALVEVKNLKKYFYGPKGAVHAVDDVTMNIDAGETMGVVGESGCGKSTLGRTIIHLQKSTGGSVHFNGKDITNPTPQELKNSSDVLSMLEQYKENAGAAFRKELDIVCADMRSSSYEAALTRFEARLNSPQLSDVVRGLIGVLRGDDGAVYFQMLTHDFKQTELQRLKAKAAKIPPKIRVYSFAMRMCFLATYFAIIIYEIIRSMGTLF